VGVFFCIQCITLICYILFLLHIIIIKIRNIITKTVKLYNFAAACILLVGTHALTLVLALTRMNVKSNAHDASFESIFYADIKLLY